MGKALKRTTHVNGHANRYAPYVRAGMRIGATLYRHYQRRRAAQASAQRQQQARRTIFVRVPPVGTGSSLSFYKGGRKPKLLGKLLKQLQPARVMNQTTSQRLESTIGTQCVTSDIFGSTGQVQDYFAQLTSGGSNTQRLYIKKITADYLISNATSSNTFLRIYELMARRDFNAINATGSQTLSEGAYSSTPLWHPTGAFDQGIYDITTSSSNAATGLGASPFQSKLFTSNWKVMKCYNIELGSGRSHKHTTTYNLNTMISEDRVGKDVASRRCQILGGITRAVMIVAYGAPVNSDANDANVSTAKSALNIVRMDRHEVHSVDPQGGKVYRISTLPTVTDPQEVDEEGNVQAPTEA